MLTLERRKYKKGHVQHSRILKLVSHSGVSWALNGGKKTIRLINNWPDPTARNSSQDKVPSAISYTNGKPQKWGYTVGMTDESFKWIKILLEENHKYAATVEPVKDSNTLLRKVDKTAQGVVADYLRLLWGYTLDDIRKFHPDFLEIFALRVVLTVPAVWSHAAKEKTRQAARLAGLPEDITLVTEPEAAALATLKERAEEQTLKVRQDYLQIRTKSAFAKPAECRLEMLSLYAMLVVVQ